MTSESKHIRVRVYHDYYGCETGCCGHTVELKSDGNDGVNMLFRKFSFSHPYGEDARQFARELAEEVIRKNWPDCLSSIDWHSLEVDEVIDD